MDDTELWERRTVQVDLDGSRTGVPERKRAERREFMGAVNARGHLRM